MTNAGMSALAAACCEALPRVAPPPGSPHCVIGRVQVDGLRSEGEGSLAPLVLLQEGPEVVVHVRDWNERRQLFVLTVTAPLPGRDVASLQQMTTFHSIWP